MCTSFLTNKIQPLSEEEQNLILNLGNIVSAILSKCLEYGKIIILTNSSENWFKQTAIGNLGISDLVDKNIKIWDTTGLINFQTLKINEEVEETGKKSHQIKTIKKKKKKIFQIKKI